MAEISRLWDKLTREEFAKIDSEFLASFRDPTSASANKFVAWDPYERSSRYLKFLLFTVAERQPAAFFEAYRKLKNCDLGKPLTIRCSGCDINADYLGAIEEWMFMSSLVNLEGVRKVTEIGAGFGRTCHTLLTLCPSIEEYTIVDLEPMLGLSGAYLNRVAPKPERIKQVRSDDYAAQDALSEQDLVINIDSFQEMPPNVIDGYMGRVVSKGKRFFCKNPVGKYLPESIGLPNLSPDRLLDVFELGYCQGVIDIFSDEDLVKARRDYLRAYCPPTSGNRAYGLEGSKPMEMFPYYQHALFARHPVAG